MCQKSILVLIGGLCLLIGTTTSVTTDSVADCVADSRTQMSLPEKATEDSFFNGTLLIAGSTGDLAKRKLIPALYELIKNQNLRGLFIFTGRQDNLSAADIIGRAKPFIKDLDPVIVEKLTSMSLYWRLSGNSPQEFKSLRLAIEEQEKSKGLSGARSVFLALPADSFCSYTRELVNAGIIVKNNKQQRIVYEKPFGSDLKSAREINTCIKDTLNVDQAYRVDHYLAKNILESLPSLIHNSALLCPAWSNKSIQLVKIFFDESIGIEGRGAFYDRYGALLDVVQNHVLQMLAIVASGAGYSKIDILKALRVKSGVRAQYENYQEEPDVAPKSGTETYVALELEVDLPHWKTVPFLIRTGKHLQRKATEIEITFAAQNNQKPDVLTIQVSPEERVVLTLHATQLDGTTKEINLASLFATKAVDPYENVLYDLMTNQSKASVTLEEIEAQWSFVEQVQALKLPLVCYRKNSAGPHNGQMLMREHSSSSLYL